ncbi:MAG: LD-carboxypeptidase, partial [Bacillaceae bacterium]|nr:LD-carboxypeptidase [Bacillaceae bacterium]
MKPLRLKKGDTVGIIAPESPPKQEKLKLALP